MSSIVAAAIAFAQPIAAQNNVDLSLTQTTCLTEAIYFESRSEGTEGGAAVAYVVLNRAVLEQESLCSVIHDQSQFSFYVPGKPLYVGEPTAWRHSADIAVGTQVGTMPNPVENATFYNTVPFRGLKHVVFVAKIKHQYFYQYVSASREAPFVKNTNVVTGYTPVSQPKITEASLLVTHPISVAHASRRAHIHHRSEHPKESHFRKQTTHRHKVKRHHKH